MHNLKDVKLIVAKGLNNEIGKGNDLVWKISEDLKFFKEMTKGNNVIMGKKTFDSLPNLLPERRHVVITTDFTRKNCDVVKYVHDIKDVHRAVDKNKGTFVIGGGKVYEWAIPHCKEMYITEIESTCDDAEVYFPNFDESEWVKELVERVEKPKGDNPPISIYKYTRK